MTAPAIVIPSAGRAEIVTTDIEGQILFVPESEAADYQVNNPDTIIHTHPDAQFKNLAEKRQAIYEKYECVFMVDDDIDFVSRLYKPGNNREEHLDPGEIADLIRATSDVAARAGCYLYGFNATPNAKHYYPHKPIELTAYINACAFGLHPSPALYFTTRTTAAESHWINLVNAYAHRKAWVDMRFHFAQKPNSTFFRPGGQAKNRTLETEKADTIFLRRMFGQAIQLKRARADAKKDHPYQRTINNPL